MALTTRGMKEPEMARIAELIDRVLSRPAHSGAGATKLGELLARPLDEGVDHPVLVLLGIDLHVN